MIHVPVILAAAGIRAYCKYKQDKDRAAPKPEWSGTIKSPRPLPEVRASVREYLRAQRFQLHSDRKGVAAYRRGDVSIKRLPCDRDVGWPDVPLVLGVSFRAINGVSYVTMCFAGWVGTKFSEPAAAYFREHAELELDGAIEFLNRGAEIPLEEPEPPRDTMLDADLGLLGLARGFSWEQLQAAYRAACRKYHPDRLVGVPADVVTLAQDHFVKVQAAYERLRQRTPQPC